MPKLILICRWKIWFDFDLKSIIRQVAIHLKKKKKDLIFKMFKSIFPTQTLRSLLLMSAWTPKRSVNVVRLFICGVMLYMLYSDPLLYLLDWTAKLNVRQMPLPLYTDKPAHYGCADNYNNRSIQVTWGHRCKV